MTQPPLAPPSKRPSWVRWLLLAALLAATAAAFYFNFGRLFERLWS